MVLAGRLLNRVNIMPVCTFFKSEKPNCIGKLQIFLVACIFRGDEKIPDRLDKAVFEVYFKGLFARRRSRRTLFMIDFQDICKSYGAQTLLDHVSFRINSGDRVGVVGANGAGKTTLFSIITGDLAPDSGSVNLPRDLRIGCLHQNLDTGDLDTPVVNYTADAIAELRVIAAELHEIEEKMGRGEASERLLTRHGELQSSFEHLGGYTLKADAEAALCGLGFRPEALTDALKNFSGGWRMRAALARVLIARPDVLLLDEPSNYLDIPAVEWLCRFLKNYAGTLLLISHDRFLLNRLTNVTLEVNKGQVTRYPGNYDFYRRERAMRAQTMEARYQNQERRRAEMQRTIDRFRAKSTKAALARSLQKQLDRMEEVETLDDLAMKGTLRLPDPPKAGAEAARFEKVTFGYTPDKLLFKDLDLDIGAGDRIAFIGYNGMGKTTLLKLLLGRLKPLAGRVVLGHHIVPGYLAQEFADLLVMENTVYDTVKAAAGPNFPLNNLPAVLGSFGFPGDNAYKPCQVLSGGEKIRLCFARIFVNPPNLLILDEPTTHLDIAGREVLQEVLRNYAGTLCLVSHDIEFVRNVATTIVAMRELGVKKYFGNYDYFLEKSAAENQPAPSLKTAPAPEKSENSKARRQERARRRQALSEEKKRVAKQVSDLEKKMERYEARQTELLTRMAEPPGPDFGDMARELAVIQDRIQDVTAAWEQAMNELEKIQAANAAIHEE